MAKNLVIVESPAKAKTITKFLGTDFKVLASFGHVRDLPKSKLGVDVDCDYTPEYETMKDKVKVIKELKAQITDKTQIWLATDEDREGEAIAWHLLSALKLKKDQIDSVKRIVFHEITESAIKGAVEEPRDIDRNLVDAQQARRVLDRLVGYKLSPLLWKKIRYGLSAGRVQSVAVRMIVEREREIQAFDPQEYWSLQITAENDKGDTVEATLFKWHDKKADLKKEADAKEVIDHIADKEFKILNIEKKETKRNPAPPFITSTLQADIARKLGYPVKRTMSIAQHLYEGVEVPGIGATGLITYMRTDSTNLSKEALAGVHKVITEEFGTEYALNTPRIHSKKAKGAQEAHEAIRPTRFDIPPSKVKDILKPEEYKVYDIIWKRTLACQMAQAILDKTAVDIQAGDAIFRANGQIIKFPGFLKAYVEDVDEEDQKNEDKAPAKETFLPPLEEGEAMKYTEDKPAQHFTKPPARYTEASLVKKLEAEGIGRPSTYAPTISTVIDRGYIERMEKALKPTELADTVSDFLVENFDNIVDYHFTANMESKFDAIAEGETPWVPVIDEFYKPFITAIKEKDSSLQKGEVIEGRTCPKCQSEIVKKFGRRGQFIACSQYPECDFTEQTEEEKQKEKEIREQVGEILPCEECGAEMKIKSGRFGNFLGCSAYPECKGIRSIVKKTGHACPDCKGKEVGNVVEKKTKKGKIFYGCDQYPKCDFAAWDLKQFEEGAEQEPSAQESTEKS